ncbi:MAG: DMT family transporter, partial [Carboxydocellales bacterium]
MALLKFLLLALIWSSTWIAIKIGLQDFPPILSAGARFVVAALFLFGLVRLKSVPLPSSWSDFKPAVIFGCLNGIGYGFIYWGEQHISSSMTAILNSSLPFFSTLLAYWLLHEELDGRKIGALVLGFTGVLIVFGSSTQGGSPMACYGQGAIIVAAAIYALGSVMLKKSTVGSNQPNPPPDPLLVVTVQMAMSAIVLLAVGIPLEYNQQVTFSLAGIISFLYLAIFGSAIAFLIYYNLLQQWEVTRVAYISLITPIIASLIGVLWYQEA